ncbi:hypothetical protein QAD02_023002 [Eretmocerus hayati]|uniref:Uncharacterized protein n=1 Tax=Eretmocerus hayati TaxID=131215 RepID=A0ACC2PW82_9HYME|nr:hypothetical protein QAD02_023002 [Eretmocerus hayati]
MNTTSKAIYRVVTILKRPFVEYDEEKNLYSGMLIDILNELSRRLNFQYEIGVRNENEYGYMDDEGNWNGLIQDLKERKADIGLGALALMSERKKVVDFTEPIYEPSGISVLMLKPENQSTLFRFLSVLESEVWFCILGAFIFTSLLLWLFDKHSPYSYQNNQEKYRNDPDKRIFGLRESMWFCLTSLTPQGGGEAPKNLSGRLVAATWWLFGFIIIASYTANLAAKLTLSKVEKSIESFDDLVNQFRHPYSVINNSDTYKYFERMNYIETKSYEIWKDMTLNDSLSPYERAQLAVWEYPLSDKYIKIFSSIKHHNTSQNITHGLKRFESDSKFALITETTNVRYQVLTDCRFREIGPEFSKKPIAIALQKNSPLTEKFNSVIRDLEREYWLSANKDKWWKMNPDAKKCYDADDMDGISVSTIGGVFILVGIGIAISFLTLAFEYFYFRKSYDRITRNHEVNAQAIENIVPREIKLFRAKVVPF